MNFCRTHRDRKKIAQIKNLLRGQERFRDLLLFVVGINSGLRISDLLELQVAHFLDDQGHIQQRFWIKEKKRGKRQEVIINESIQEAPEEYLAAYSGIKEKPENFIFLNPKTNDNAHPIKRSQGWKFITSICRTNSLLTKRTPALKPHTFYLALIAALTLGFPSLKQNIDSTGTEPLIVTDARSEYPLGPHLAVLEDRTGELTVEDVASQEFETRFVPSQNEVPNYGFTDSAYWVRFRLRNESQMTEHWILELGFANMHYVDLYVPAAEGYDTRKTGVLQPFNTRDIPNRQVAFDLPLPVQAERTYYLRFQSGGSMTLPLTVWEPEIFFQASASEQLFLGLFYGVFLILLVYNLFLLYSLREASYLYFVCFLASGILLFASYDALAFQYLWPNLPAWNRYAVPLFFILFMASITKFADAFLETSARIPGLHLLIKFLLGGWGFAILLLPFVSYRMIMSLLTPFGLLSLGVAGIAGLISWRRRYLPARFYLFSWVGLIFGGSVVLLVRFGAIPSTNFTEQVYRIGIIWMVAFWAVALADRINLLKKGTEKANLEVQASETRYRRLVETMNDGLGVVDEAGRFTYINDRLAEMLGYTREELLGHPALELTDVGNQQIFREHFEQRKTGDSTPYELTWRRKGGSELFSIVSPMPLFENGGQYKGAFAVVTDITDRVLAGRLLEGRVAERTRELTTLLDLSRDINTSQELELVLNRVLERLKTVVDYCESTILAQQEDRWITLARHWPSRLKDSDALELLPAEIQALEIEFELGEPILISSISQETTRRDGFTSLASRLAGASTPHASCWLGLPMFEKERLVGVLILGHEQPDAFSEDQVKLAMAFANQMAIAIENNHLYQQIHDSAVAEERNRLARDLHDSVTQMLFSASLVAELLPIRVRNNPDLALESAAELRRLTHGALAEMRTLLLELRPSTITMTPLGELLTQLTESITSRTGLSFQLYIDNLPPLTEQVQITCYRIAQESLNNIGKHAQASQVMVSLSAAPPIKSGAADDWAGEIKMVLKDDGIGFFPEDNDEQQMGLGIMQERAAAIHATLSISSHAGQGTEVTFIWRKSQGRRDG